MFHKRSTNVPKYDRNETKRLSPFPNLSYRRRSFLFSPVKQILDKVKTICFQSEKFGNDTKTFWFRFQNDIGTYILSFLTLLLKRTVVHQKDRGTRDSPNSRAASRKGVGCRKTKGEEQGANGHRNNVPQPVPAAAIWRVGGWDLKQTDQQHAAANLGGAG